MGVTIKDIANLTNTSTATVSRVLNGKPGVEDDKRQRVLSLAEKLGYRPNRIAQSLALQKSQVVGFVAADLKNSFYIDLFRRVQKGVEALGYQVLIADSEQNPEKEKHNIEVMRQHRANGVIVFPVHDWRLFSDVDVFMRLWLERFPFVVVGKLNGITCDSVTSDETETAFTLTQHLLSLGHRRIAFVGHDPDNRPVVERCDGVRRALQEAGATLDENDLIYHRDGWPAEMTKMLKRPDRPTALVIMNDVCALIAYRPLLEMGLRIPQDISVVSFGNSIWTNHLIPSLTTTSERNEEVARVALELILRRMENPDSPPVQRLIPQDIVVRESTGAPAR